LIASFALLIVLIAVSTTRENQYIMNIGETRRVYPPFLITDVTISSIGSGSAAKTSFARVFNLAKCPPLEGPPVTTQNHMDLTLAPDDFQYDYFHLNSGSTISVHLQLSQGSTNVYLLRGSQALRRIEDNDESEYFSNPQWNHQAIFARFVTAGTGPVQFHYLVPDPNVYIVVYDNASTATGVLSLDYSVTMTTYDLRDEAPLCQAPSSVSPCTVAISQRPGCLLVQAVYGPDDSSGASSTSGSSSDDVVTVQLGSNRNWVGLISLSFVPFVLQLVYSSFFLCFSSRRSSPDERPPPYNPESGLHDYGAVSDLGSHPLPSAPPVDGEPILGHSYDAPDAASTVTVMVATVLPAFAANLPTVTLVPAEDVFPVPEPTPLSKP
jgi:hypothetical protein